MTRSVILKYVKGSKKKMSDILLNRVKLNLKSQFYLVNDSWLKECIEYYISENNDVSLNAIQAFVTSQWLLSDLREINNEKGSVPPNLSRQEKIVLPGKYVLQVDKMCDISQSKYSQLQKIRNVSEVNIKATSVETPAWEPKGKRMIQMHLTDGIQGFTAIEYRPIKALKDTLLPGFKVMIIGPVECRKGVIMLKEENYKEIGGEVDSLLKVNALENVLARALGMEENENPYADSNQENNAGQFDDEFPEDEFDMDFDEITQIERLSLEVEESRVDRALNNDVSNPRNNVPDNRNSQNAKEVVRENQNSTKNTSIAHSSKPGTETRDKFQRNSREIETIDDSKQDLSPFFDTRNGDEKDSKIVSRTQLKPIISQPSNFRSQDKGFDKFANRGMGNGCKDGGKSLKDYSEVPSTSRAIVADDCFDAADFEDELDEDMFRENNPIPVEAEKDMEKNISKIAVKPRVNTEKTFDSPKEPATKTNTCSLAEGKSQISTGRKRSADKLLPSGCSPKMICLQKAPPVNQKDRKITEFTEKILPKEDMPAKMCDFICDVIREPRLGSVTYKTVRGKVTSIGKLVKKDKNWDLQATISDGTASLDIKFSSQVLEDLIGFGVPEFLEKKKLWKTNPEVEEYLRKGFRNAEIIVQRMDVLMELELSSENELPKVVNTTELSEPQKEIIEKRRKMMAL